MFEGVWGKCLCKLAAKAKENKDECQDEEEEEYISVDQLYKLAYNDEESSSDES